jgi:protein phosphatase
MSVLQNRGDFHRGATDKPLYNAFSGNGSMASLTAVTAHGVSHTGKYREENQDTIRLHEPHDEVLKITHGHLYAIADGMGGYSHGATASALALETFFDTFYGGQASKSPNNLKQAAQNANTAVYQAAHRLGNVRMGTTLSAVNIIGHELHIAHIGDSRVYLIRDGRATCLTRDHTVVGDMVSMKVLSPDKVRKHDRRSILNKCIGIQLFVQPDITRHELRAGDTLILCSDGVWSVIEDVEFAALVQDTEHLDALNHMLIETALERDSDDNVSSISVQVHQVAAVSERKGFGLAQFLRGRLGKS